MPKISAGPLTALKALLNLLLSAWLVEIQEQDIFLQEEETFKLLETINSPGPPFTRSLL